LKSSLLFQTGAIASFILETPSSGSNTVTVDGTLTPAGALSVQAGPGFAPGTYVLFNYTTLASGSFEIAQAPSGYNYEIENLPATDQLDLVVSTPEPGPAALLLLTPATLLIRRRRLRR
jgi:hypothetical protein